MNSLPLVALLLAVVAADHLQVGNTADRVALARHEVVEYNAIPFVKRIKYFFYAGPDYSIIQGILALDQLHSKASINVTAGGVGYSFVNLRMKSERGVALSYDIGIYVSPAFTYK